MTYSDAQVGEIVEGLAAIQSGIAERGGDNSGAEHTILRQAIDVLLSSAKGWHGTVWCDECAGAGTVSCLPDGERTCSVCNGAGYFTPSAVIALRDSGSRAKP